MVEGSLRAVLLDLEGTLFANAVALPGAATALRSRNCPGRWSEADRPAVDAHACHCL